MKKIAILTTCISCAVGVIVGASAVGLFQHARYKAIQPTGRLESPVSSNENYGVQPPATADSPNSGTPNPNTSKSNPQGITMDQAKAIALNKAGYSESEVFFEELSRDFEDGREVYEIEFKVDGAEYSAEILVSDGTVISWEVEHDFSAYIPTRHHSEHHY